MSNKKKQGKHKARVGDSCAHPLYQKCLKDLIQYISEVKEIDTPPSTEEIIAHFIEPKLAANRYYEDEMETRMHKIMMGNGKQ